MALSNLIITEYIEGSSNNKAIELYNGTGSLIDLSGYVLEFYFNGSTSAGTTIALSGTLADGEVYVVADNDADPAILAAADLTSLSNFFNGDDTILLVQGGTIVDSIGQLGTDPGSQWGSGDTSTQNNTLRRQPTVMAGDTNADDAFDPSMEWEGFPEDTVDGLGAYEGSGGGTADIAINEIRIDQPSDDNDEYFELAGVPDAALDGLSYIVLGDGTGGSGVIEAVVDLTGQAIASDGFFVAAEDTFSLATADFTTSLNFENGDNVTHLLVDGFTGSNGDDLDTDDDGTLDITPWRSIVNSVALVATLGSGDQIYSDTQVGPNGSFVPAQVYRDPDGTGDFLIGSFDPQAADANDTPGASNNSDDGGGGNGSEPKLISEIQGSGAASPLQGQTVTIEAVVTGDFQDGSSGTNGNLNGFFVQEEDADADDNLLTSEGLFIFDGSSPSVDVSVGDVVQVTGTVVEFNELTELTNVTVSVVDTGSLPTPAVVNLPTDSVITNSDGDFLADLEQFEGMSVTVPDTLFVTEYFNLDRFGEIVLSSNGASNEPGTDGRLDQYTDFNAPSVAGFAAYQEEIAKRRIVVDDGQTIQNPDPIILGRGGQPLSENNTLRGGDTVTGLSGILSYGFGEYRIQPVAPIDFQPTNPRPQTPEEVGGDLTVVSFNVLNFFTTLDVSGNPGSGPNNLEPRGADSPAEFDRQLEKLVTALEALEADILGLVELENEFNGDQNGDGQFAIDTLVKALNDRAGAGTYAFVDPGVPFVDTGDAISVGAIYRTDTVRVAPGTTVEILTDSDLPALGLDGTVFDGPNTNRAPIAVSFEEISTGEVFTVSVNHFKSKGGTGSGDDADAGDGQGNFNGTRVRGAQALEAWLETDPTGSNDEDVLILGDLNAYAQEDPITLLESEGYTDLIEQFVGSDAYSFVFDGQFGYLDYALANTTLLSQITGVTDWHTNADEPDAFDYNLDFGRNPALFDGQTPFRASDHDPLIIGLDLSSPVVEPNRIEGTQGDDVIQGTRADDLISGNNGNDIIFALGGDDIVEGGRGGDIIRGGKGNDVLAADRIDRFQDFDGKVSQIAGGAGDDILFGGSKDDVLKGGKGNDLILGKSGDDWIHGGSGDDLLNGGVGDDFINGAGGSDTADYSDLAIEGVFGTVAGVDANVSARVAKHSSTNKALAWEDRLFNIENVIGTQRNDRFIGNRKDNIFDGRSEVGRSDRRTTFIDQRGSAYEVTADVAEYQGMQADYTFGGTADSLTVSGKRIGTDTLIDIEFLRFNGDDAVVATADLF